MKTDFFFLSPVQVVKVTSQNLEEVAEWCGGSVQETESRRVKGRMDKYVLVPTPSEKNISWAFPGMFITKRLVVTIKDELRSTFAVFRRDYFEKNYFETPKSATDKTWEREESEKNSKKARNVEVRVNVNVGNALIEAQKELARLQHEKADRIMTRKSDAELKELLAGGHITEEDLARKAGGEAVAEAEGSKPFVHHHKLDESCDATGCETDRYVDGVHVFSDEVVHASPDGWRTEKSQQLAEEIEAENLERKSYLEQLVSTPMED
jgi:hypothetical protein